MDISLLITALLFALILFFSLIIFIIRQNQAPPPYKIVVLGPKQSGKTVFLASMYYRLSIQSPDVGFLLDTPNPEDRNRLIAYKEKISSSGEDFPDPNQLRPLKEWTFTCKVRSSTNALYPLMNLTYLDYAGERIKLLYDANTNEFTQEFQMALNSANVFLGILDGERVVKLVQGTVDDTFYSDLYLILHLLQKSKQPAHFIITKWDQIEEKRYSLGQILSCLLKYPPFKDFVNTQIELQHTLRLIPVSAVGSGFAQLRPDGMMGKVPGALLRPFQVEMPLACILYDCLDSSLRKSGIYKRWFHDSHHRPGPFTKIALFLVWLAGSASLTLGPFGISFQNFSDGARNILGKPMTASAGNSKIYSKKDAATQVIDRTWTLLLQLEQKFEESNLTKFMSRLKP